MHGTITAAISDSDERDPLPGQDLVELARYLVPLEASMVCGCLVASGVPAALADANLVQTDMLLAPALGGVRILVPPARLAEAQGVLAAFERGEFMLDEDADVGGG